MSLLKLIGEPAASAAAAGRQLLARVRVEVNDVARQQNFVELIATALFYKYENVGREEIEIMRGISGLRHTRVFQEAKQEGREEGREEGRSEAIPLLIEGGISIEQIAERWNLNVSTVEDMAIAALKKLNRPTEEIAKQLGLSGRIQMMWEGCAKERRDEIIDLVPNKKKLS